MGKLPGDLPKELSAFAPKSQALKTSMSPGTTKMKSLGSFFGGALGKPGAMGET